jgi:hypothetical protein
VLTYVCRGRDQVGGRQGGTEEDGTGQHRTAQDKTRPGGIKYIHHRQRSLEVEEGDGRGVGTYTRHFVGSGWVTGWTEGWTSGSMDRKRGVFVRSCPSAPDNRCAGQMRCLGGQSSTDHSSCPFLKATWWLSNSLKPIRRLGRQIDAADAAT